MAESRLKYRKALVKVSNDLCSDEVDQLVYLADVNKRTRQTIRQGIHLFEYLEDKRQVGPRNFTFMFELLEVIGRQDLIKLILEENVEAIADAPPTVRQSLSYPAQVLLQKRTVMLCKTEVYNKKMKELKDIMHSGKLRLGRFSDLFLKLICQVSPKALSSHEDELGLLPSDPQSEIKFVVHDLYVETIHELSRFWQRWPSMLETFQQAGFNSELSHLVEQCHSIFDSFHHKLPPAWSKQFKKEVLDLRNKQQHPIGQVARHAHGILHELSSELLGSSALDDSNEMLQKALFTIESVNYTARYLIPIYKWQATLIRLVAPHITDTDSFRRVVCMIVSEHSAEIRANWDIIGHVVGDNVAEKLDKLLPRQAPSDQKSQQLDEAESCFTSRIAVPWYVMLAILGCSAECIIDRIQVQEKLYQYMMTQKAAFMKMYVNLSEKMASSMEKEVQCFRESYGHVIGELAPNSDYSRIMAVLFDQKL